MASAATIAGSAAVIKELYPYGDVPWTIYKNYNGFLWLEKNEDFVGDPVRVAIQTETTQGGSATFATAQANIQQSAYSAFYVHRVEDFSIARIDNHALAAADGQEGSLVNLWEREIDSAMKTAMLQAETMIYRMGTGTRGVVGSISTNKLTLATPTDVVNFAVGMPVTSSAADGGALDTAGAQEVIAGIDRVNGVLLSTSVNWTTVIAGIAATHFLQRAGDGANGGTNLVLTGMQGWIPGGTLTSPPANLFGCTRSNDPTGTAGQTYNATGSSEEDALIEAVARAGIEGGQPDAVLMHPRQKAALIKSAQSQTRYVKEKAAIPGTLGFADYQFVSDYGAVDIISSPSVPFNTAFLVQKDVWELGSIGKCPRIQDFDTLEYLRVSNADQLEVRIYAYYQMVCRGPRWNVQIQNLGA